MRGAAFPPKTLAFEGRVLREPRRYSTGPKLREADLGIHELVAGYSVLASPILVIVDVQPKELGIPTKAYCCVDEVRMLAPLSLSSLLRASCRGRRTRARSVNEIACRVCGNTPARPSAQSGDHHAKGSPRRVSLSFRHRPKSVPPTRLDSAVSVVVPESSRASPPHRPREAVLAHPADTSRTNLASAFGLLSRCGGTDCASRVAQVREDGTQRAMKTFMHVPSEIDAYEAEEICVEHLLRDVKDAKVRLLLPPQKQNRAAC